MSNDKVASTDKMGLTARISEHIASLCMSSDYSDVTICVENECLPVHKVVIVSYDYFRILLCGKLAESTQSVIKLDVDVAPFKAILRYIYFGYLSLVDLSYEAIFEILQLADMFLLTVLADSILKHFEQILTTTNVLNILELSRLYKFDLLIEACFVFVDGCATDVLRHADFQKLSQVCSKSSIKFAQDEELCNFSHFLRNPFVVC